MKTRVRPTVWEYSYQGFQEQDRFEQSSRSSTNRAINPLSKSREPLQQEDLKRYSRESGSEDEEKAEEIRSSKNSQMFEVSSNSDLYSVVFWKMLGESAFGKGSKASNLSDNDVE